MSIGPAEILVIFVIALLVFGPTRLPEVGRQVGKGIKELRKFQHTLKSDLDDTLADDASYAAEPAPSLPPMSPPPDGTEGGPIAGAPPAEPPAVVEGTPPPAPPEPS